MFILGVYAFVLCLDSSVVLFLMFMCLCLGYVDVGVFVFSDVLFLVLVCLCCFMVCCVQVFVVL